jgi:hypothetical protein
MGEFVAYEAEEQRTRKTHGMASGHVSRRFRRQVVELDGGDTLVDTVDDPLGNL